MKPIFFLTMAKYYLILFVFLFHAQLPAQPADYEQQLLLAHNYVEKGKYSDAIKIYQTLTSKYPNKPQVYLNLAETFRQKGQFEESLKILSTLLNVLPQSENTMHQLIKEKMQVCQTAIKLSDSSICLKINDLGAKINSRYSENSPLITADESMLVFTSNKMIRGKTDKNIFFSRRMNGKWITARAISPLINTPDDEQAVGMSVDGQTLFIRKKNKGNNDLYVSYRKKNKWSVPELLSANINSEFDENSASISADERLLYFSSNRPGGKGGFDIYVSEKGDDGNWLKAKLLEGNINTTFDEKTPFLHSGGSTLYFSSNGRENMGDFDIFESKLSEDGFWQEPKNLGSPINTTGDDLSFSISPDKLHAYYSRRLGEKKQNIFEINFPPPVIDAFVVYSGVLYLCDYKPLDQVKITVTDSETLDLVGIYRPNAETGNFTIVLKPGRKYHALFTATGYLGYFHEFNVLPDSAYHVILRAVDIPPLKFYNPPMKNGITHTEIHNILFDVNSFKIRENDKKTLDLLADYLLRNSTVRIELGGNTDDIGDEKYNMHLSNKRAKAIKYYLMRRGVSESNIEINDYGEGKPIAINNNPDGTPNLEGRKYNRRVDFKILKAGTEKLTIRPLTVPAHLRVK